MRGRLTRSVVDPAALLRNAKPLTGRDRETKKKRKKEEKKSSKGCAEPGFRKPANFLGETAFFLENGLLVQFLRGGPRGSAAEAGCEPQGVKNTKNWGKMLSFEASTCKFPYKTAFFAYKAIWPNPPNFFSPSRICVFPVRSC